MLTEAELEALREEEGQTDQPTNPGDQGGPVPAGEVSGQGGEGPEPQPVEQAEEAQAEPEAPSEPAEKTEDEEVVLTKDGKHVIPYSVLKELREENRQLREKLEALAQALPKEQPKGDDRVIVQDGEEYVPLDKATLDELLAARVEKLQEGDYKTVNAIDLRIMEIKQTEAMVYSEFMRSRNEFASNNPWYGQDPVLTRLADNILMELDSDPAWKGKSFQEGWEEVARRLSPYVPDTFRPKADGKPQVKQPAKKVVSVAGVPNIGPAATDDKWAQLDRLAEADPAAYEEAIMRMTPAEYAAYANRR